MNNENIKWSEIARIAGIISIVVSAVWWASTISSDVKYIKLTLDDLSELKTVTQRHDTEIKVIQTQLSSKEK